MAYGTFTQGTILEGVRLARYPNIRCYGIVITARCDLAQNKAENIFYLTAMDVQTWLKTEGILYCAGQKIKKGFAKILENFGEKVPDLAKYKNASQNDVERAIRDIHNLKENPKIDSDTEATIESLDKELNKIKLFILKNAEADIPTDLIMGAYGYLDNVFDDKLSQYHFIPALAYASEADKVDPKKYDSLHYNGLIVNLADVSFWEKDLVKKIEDQKLDYTNLMDDDRREEIKSYNAKFFLEMDGNKIFPELEIESPYIERLMQVYTSLFARIGVEFEKDIAKEYWKQNCKKIAAKNAGGTQ